MIKAIIECFLILFFHDKYVDIKAKKYIKSIENYKKQKLIKPNELISTIEQQENVVYYENQSYDFYGSYHEKYTITLQKNKKDDCGLDIVYYLLINADNKIKEYVLNIMSLQNNTPVISAISTNDLEFLKKCLKKISGIDIKFIDKQKELEKELKKEEREYEHSRAESYYRNALEDYNTGDYESAEEFINLAIDIVNCKKYRSLQEKITNKTFPNNISNDITTDNNIQIKNNTDNTNNKRVSSKKKIKLETCNKAELLTIDGFDEEKADRFIKERDNGKYYYDIETFVSAFELMPHQMVEISDRLVFPQKPKNKIGRKIDL